MSCEKLTKFVLVMLICFRGCDDFIDVPVEQPLIGGFSDKRLTAYIELPP